MAQPGRVQIHIEVPNVEGVRRLIKRIKSDAEEANRMLASLEERLTELEERLARAYGIGYHREETPHD